MFIYKFKFKVHKRLKVYVPKTDFLKHSKMLSNFDQNSVKYEADSAKFYRGKKSSNFGLTW